MSLYCTVTEIVPQSVASKRDPLQFAFVKDELDICRYSIVPERGLYIHIAKQADPEVEMSRLEKMSVDLLNKPVTIEFFDAETGKLVKRVEARFHKYMFEEDEEFGFVDRVFLGR